MGLPLWPELSGSAYLRLIGSATLGIAIADTMFVAALNRLGASLQALADCIYSPCVAAVGFMIFGEALSSRDNLGGSLVLCGVAVGVGLASSSEHTPKELLQGVAWRREFTCKGVVLPVRVRRWRPWTAIRSSSRMTV